MLYRIINIGDHEMIQSYEPCPVCGDDMQSIVFLGDVCWTCYDNEKEKEKEKNIEL